MINFLWFIINAVRAYKVASTCNAAYVAKTYRGVPCIAFIVARDREAWRVTNLALNHAATLMGAREQ
jgi:hypothetical protein